MRLLICTRLNIEKFLKMHAVTDVSPVFLLAYLLQTTGHLNITDTNSKYTTFDIINDVTADRVFTFIQYLP